MPFAPANPWSGLLFVQEHAPGAGTSCNPCDEIPSQPHRSPDFHNSVRARAYLTHAQTEKGEKPDPDLRDLIFKKNNYGPVAERILLRWERGVFVPEGGGSSLEKLAAEQRVDERFLQLLAQFTQQGRNLKTNQGLPLQQQFVTRNNAGTTRTCRATAARQQWCWRRRD
jgi:hypothetical protein